MKWPKWLMLKSTKNEQEIKLLREQLAKTTDALNQLTTTMLIFSHTNEGNIVQAPIQDVIVGMLSYHQLEIRPVTGDSPHGCIRRIQAEAVKH